MILSELLAAWFETFGNNSVKVKTVVNDASERLKNVLMELAPNGCGGINEISLGKKLQKYAKRIEEGYQLERMAKNQGTANWRVTQLDHK